MRDISHSEGSRPEHGMEGLTQLLRMPALVRWRTRITRVRVVFGGSLLWVVRQYLMLRLPSEYDMDDATWGFRPAIDADFTVDACILD